MVSFTIAVKNYWSKQVGYIKRAVKMAAEDRDDVVLPEWESSKKWLVFERKFQAYLWLLRGGLLGVTPLVYVIRDEEDVTDAQVTAVYASLEKDLYDGPRYGGAFQGRQRAFVSNPIAHFC
jgi:hypothetical protein